MEPITTAAILWYVAKKFGDHYLPKILDAADRGILDNVGRDKEMPDVAKVERYLKENPKAAQKVEEQLAQLQVKGVVLPPEGTQLLPADRLVVFAGVMNAILSVMKQQQRDFATDGFFNSNNAMAIFNIKLGTDPGTVSVANKEIDCNLVFTEIFLLEKSADLPSPTEINESLRNAAADATSFVRIRDISRLQKVTEACKPERQVRAIHPTFVEPGRGYLGPKYKTITDLDRLPPDLAAFLKLSTPYDSTVRMLDHLASEFGKFYLSPEEVKQLRDLAGRLAPGGALRET